MMTDPIADMLTRIRNAVAVKKTVVDVPFSKVKLSLGEILLREGFITGIHTPEEGRMIRVVLKYGDDGSAAIRHLRRLSRPGQRTYVGKENIPVVLGGLGIAIISTSQGLMTDREARKGGVGGELMCEVY